MARDNDITPLILVAGLAAVYMWYKKSKGSQAPGYDYTAEYRAFLSKVYPADAAQYAKMTAAEINTLYSYHVNYVTKGIEPAPGSPMDTALNAIVAKYNLS